VSLYKVTAVFNKKLGYIAHLLGYIAHLSNGQLGYCMHKNRSNHLYSEIINGQVFHSSLV